MYSLHSGPSCRRTLLLVAFFAFVLFAIPGFVSASGCGVAPSGASYCQQLSINNAQSTVTTANTQIMIQYNALAYQSYLAANMMNIEAYNSVSGALIPMWLEGNALNEQQTSNLYTSENIILWLKVPDAIAASSTDSNIYLAYFPTTTDNFGTSNYGAAPQLYCASGCPATSYAGVDNGASVFEFYDNFAGTTLSTSKWTTYEGSGAITVNNGLTISTTTDAAATTLFYTSTFAPNVIGETLILSASTDDQRSATPGFFTSNTETKVGADLTTGLITAWQNGGADNGKWMGAQGDSAAYTQSATTIASPITSPMLLGVGYTGSTNYFYGINSADAVAPYATFSSTSTYTPTGNLYFVLGIMGGSSGSGNIVMQWSRVRAYPPSGVMPSVTFGTLPPTTPLLTSSPSLPVTLDAGQQITFTASFNNGDPPYTYNYLIVNSITDAIVGNYLTTSSYSSNSFIWIATNSQSSYDLEANVVVTDSHPTTVNSVYINTLTVNPALATPTISASNTLVDAGQYINFATYETGGTLPYTYNFIVYNSVTNIQVANMLRSLCIVPRLRACSMRRLSGSRAQD